MIKSLTVENYAIIDHVDIQFDHRLNIITGENRCREVNSTWSLGLGYGSES